jgi:lipid-A-disaccharide synthase
MSRSKFFIIAGEASGDLLGSKLIEQLRIANPQATFVGVGGELMQKQQLQSIFDMSDLAVMGFVEVLPHIFTIFRRIKQTVKAIESYDPDFVITIDSPDFCFRVANKIAKKHKKIHLIAPSVWAYRQSRAQKIAKIYDLLLVILPFEPPYFTKYGLKTIFIGNPLASTEPSDFEKQQNNLLFRQQNNISLKQIVILLTPGSRKGEVQKIFPQFILAINKLSIDFRDLVIVIPVVNKTQQLVQEMAKSLQVRHIFVDYSQKKMAFSASNFALAKSGTNALEIALYRIPMIIGYKVNFLSYYLIKFLIKIKFANILNLLQNKQIIPELLQQNCNANNFYQLLKNMITQPQVAQQQIEQVAISLQALKTEQDPMLLASQQIMQL